MLRWKKRIRRLTYIFVDLVGIVIASIIASIIYTKVMNKILSITQLEKFGFLSISTILFVGLFIMLTIYEDTIEDNGHLSRITIGKMFAAYTLGSILLGAGLFYMDVTMSRVYITTYVLTIIVMMLFNRALLHIAIFRGSSVTESRKNILIVGYSERGVAYLEEIRKHAYLNISIMGYVNVKEPVVYEGLAHIGDIKDLLQIATDFVIDEIAVAKPIAYDERLRDSLNLCQNMGITVTMLLDTQNTDTSKAHVAMVGSIPVLKFHMVSLNESQIFAKRIVDVIGASVGMIAFGIAFIIIGPIIKIESDGPIIFKQDRVGKNGRIFKVWKFRSMGNDAEKAKAALMDNNEMSGHMFKMTKDPRVTRIGAFIRKTSIDELPQFYNVLKGDMSLVGTRPPTVDEVKEYEQHHRKRICITPGITGNWQVSGRSDIEDFEEVVKLDSEYIENWSVWLDIKILLKTIWIVIAGRGSK